MSDQIKKGPDREGELEVEERTQTKRPRRYRVLLHNDDYTTMDFVVMVLMQVFNKSSTEATQIMLHVHHKGQGLCGTFTKEVAETKVHQVTTAAKEAGFPLLCSMEPE